MGFFMLIGLRDISVTAFICAFKAWRPNSIYYATDKYYKAASALKMATVTFKKYMRECLERGFIRVDRYGNKTFIAMSEALPILFPEEYEGNYLKHIRFFAAFEKTPNFKMYYERIKYALALTNFRQQQYQIERKSVIDRVERNCKNVGDSKRLKNLMKKVGASCFEQLKSILSPINYIFTGKSHIAKLIGCSTATASSLISKWERNQKYQRTVLRQFVRVLVCNESFDYLISLNVGIPVANKSGTGYWLNIGSRVDLPTM